MFYTILNYKQMKTDCYIDITQQPPDEMDNILQFQHNKSQTTGAWTFNNITDEHFK